MLFKRSTREGPGGGMPFAGGEAEDGCVFVAVLITHMGPEGTGSCHK